MTILRSFYSFKNLEESRSGKEMDKRFCDAEARGGGRYTYTQDQKDGERGLLFPIFARAVSLLGFLLLHHAARALLETFHGLANVGLALIAAQAAGGLTHTAEIRRPRSDDVRVNSAGDAVLHLEVELGHHVHLVHASILQVSLSGGLDHVAHQKALNSLVLKMETW